MSIWDDRPNPLNIPFPTLGGHVFWTELDRRGGYVLQKNDVTGHCRILDAEDIRVAWGEEGPMRAKLWELAGGAQANRPQRGDVIGVHRVGGAYDHYGVYESDDCVYEYAARDGDFGSADIHTTTLERFIRDSDNLFVLAFPERHGRPGKMEIFPAFLTAGTAVGAPSGVLDLLQDLLGDMDDYHLYSPEETIQRARKKMGERDYNLIFNNCEHFAIWCKTGVHESHQVNALLGLIQKLQQTMET